MTDLLLEFAVTLPALLISLVFHEVAHGFVALQLGDKTAHSRGRLSLNPLKHLDRFGTLVLFMTYFSTGGNMLFGWAKPVPINPAYFKNPQRGMALVGLAGPTANFLTAAACALVIERWLCTDGLLAAIVFRVFQLNIVLMLFNLIPVPPLDGSRIAGAFLNRRTYMRWIQLDQYGMIFIMVLMFTLWTFPAPLTEAIRTVYRLFLPTCGF